MDLLDRTTQSRAILIACVVVSVLILVAIAVTRPTLQEPCGLEARWALACYRWEAAGWPSCDKALPDVRIVELTPAWQTGDEDVRGAWDQDLELVGVRLDSCGAQDPTTEHEQGHARGLEHGGPTGSVMASPWERTGLAIPEYEP